MDEDVHKKDLQKDYDLKEAGFEVLSFDDDEALSNIQSVRETLKNG